MGNNGLLLQLPGRSPPKVPKRPQVFFLPGTVKPILKPWFPWSRPVPLPYRFATDITAAACANPQAKAL